MAAEEEKIIKERARAIFDLERREDISALILGGVIVVLVMLLK